MDLRKKFALIIIIFHCMPLFTVNDTYAQEEFSSSLNPVGSGARATGMGGAFIGVADDATAASWNPAGLIQLEKPEVSAVYSYFHRNQSYSSSVHPEVDSENSMDSNGLNFASAVYPFSLFKRNAAVSLNYQRLYEMNKDVSYEYDRNIAGDILNEEIDFEQEGFLYTLSPAMAVQVTPAFSIGATLNIWGDYLGENGWENTYDVLSTGTLSGQQTEIRVHQKQETSFEGVNAHFGFLWAINGSFTLGGVYKTPFDADIERRTEYSQTTVLPSQSVISSEQIENLTLKMPPSYGLGVSYMYDDSLTLAVDVYLTEWSKFVLKDSSGNETNPIDGTSISDGRLKDTIQMRAGSEYLFIKEKHVVPVRFGIFYDPEPQTGSLDEYYGFSLGAGFANQRIALDASYQYRMANNISGDTPLIQGISSDVHQHVVMISSIYYF